MKLIPLIFKKIGNHWYLDIEHDDPNDLKLSPIIERYLDKLDTWKDGVVGRIHLAEVKDFSVETEGILQFSDSDLLRYFTTKDVFKMTIYIGKHSFSVSSNLYTALEAKYGFDFHITSYKFIIF